MSTPVSSPPEEPTSQSSVQQKDSQQKRFAGRDRLAKASIFSLLLILGALVIGFSGVTFFRLPSALRIPLGRQAQPPAATFQGVAQNDPLLSQLPAGRALLYETADGLALVPVTGGSAQKLSLTGYSYNRAVPPILLSSGQLLYSGNGIWLTDATLTAPRQLAKFPADQVITSLVLSTDQRMLAWSTAPLNGKGTSMVYAGLIEQTKMIYQQPAAQCPCLRPFAFLHPTAQEKTPVLLLSDDRSDHGPVYYGLWSLPLTDSAQPQSILSLRGLHGPLALSPVDNTLLYSNAKGFAPWPTDRSVPAELAAQSYANSLSLLSVAAQKVSAEQELLPIQRHSSNSAEYHWVATPSFSSDGKSLAYVLFSSDAQEPYARHNALYTVKLGQATPAPELLAVSGTSFIELGPWLNSHLLTVYTHDGLAVLDVQSGAMVKIGETAGYARPLALVKRG